MKLAQTILYVQNVEQAAAFYERVFELERDEVNPEGVYIALKTGETTLAFVDAAWVAGNGIDFAPVRPQAQPPGIEISFWVEDVEATYRAAIEAGASAWYEPWRSGGDRPSRVCAIRTASSSRSRAHRQGADPGADLLSPPGQVAARVLDRCGPRRRNTCPRQAPVDDR